jgi:hypothetical protein
MRAVGMLVIVAAGVACSGDDTTDRQAYVDALVQGMQQEDSPFTDTQVDCFAGAIIDAIGVDELNDAGISSQDLAEADSPEDLGVELPTADDIASGIVACDVDLSGQIIDVFTERLPGVELSAEARTCVAENLEDDFAAFVAQGIVGGDEQSGEEAGGELMTNAMTACPTLVTELLVAGIESQGLELTPEAEACLASEVEERGPEIGADVLAASDDPATAERLGMELLAACGELFQG